MTLSNILSCFPPDRNWARRSSRSRWGCALMVATLCSGLLCAIRPAHAQTETVLYSFGLSPDAAGPYAEIVMDKEGNVYGTTDGGGKNNYGAVFKITPSGKELHYGFCSQPGCTDGSVPLSSLIMAEGNVYGTTSQGGAKGYGTVFKITPQGEESVLYSFCSQPGCTDGSYPSAGLITDGKGNLYGTASSGGHGVGTVFKVTLGGEYSVLYSFCSQVNPCTDGSDPEAGLIFDKSGNLYGTTFAGGKGGGTVFEITASGEYGVLYSFCSQSNCTDGAGPFGRVIMDTKGNLYGTTNGGGANGTGTVFEVIAKGEESVLYSFCSQTNCTDGAWPYAGVNTDGKGNLYGTTSGGGANGNGTVFKFGASKRENVLYSFCSQTNCTDGSAPVAGVIIDTNGNLYGTTMGGGATGRGTVFKVTP